MHFFVTVNLFRTKVLPEETIFAFPTQWRRDWYFASQTKILLFAGPESQYLHLPVNSRPAPGIEPATYRSGVKCPTDWANPADKETFGCISEIIESRSASHCPSNGILEDLWQPAISTYFTTALIYKNKISEKIVSDDVGTVPEWQEETG